MAQPPSIRIQTSMKDGNQTLSFKFQQQQQIQASSPSPASLKNSMSYVDQSSPSTSSTAINSQQQQQQPVRNNMVKTVIPDLEAIAKFRNDIDPLFSVELLTILVCIRLYVDEATGFNIQTARTANTIKGGSNELQEQKSLINEKQQRIKIEQQHSIPSPPPIGAVSHNEGQYRNYTDTAANNLTLVNSSSTIHTSSSSSSSALQSDQSLPSSSSSSTSSQHLPSPPVKPTFSNTIWPLAVVYFDSALRWYLIEEMRSEIPMIIQFYPTATAKTGEDQSSQLELIVPLPRDNPTIDLQSCPDCVEIVKMLKLLSTAQPTSKYRLLDLVLYLL